MTIKEHHIQGPIMANMVEADCFTCWSAGKVIYRQFNGYAGSENITSREEAEAVWASQAHEDKKGKDHNIVIYHFKNDPVEFSDNMIGGE